MESKSKLRIAHLSGPNATIQNTPPLITSNKARRRYNLPLLKNPDGSLSKFDALRAITRKPSCLISCSQSSPLGGCGAEVGRHGAMKPAGRVRGGESMGGG